MKAATAADYPFSLIDCVSPLQPIARTVPFFNAPLVLAVTPIAVPAFPFTVTGFFVDVRTRTGPIAEPGSIAIALPALDFTANENRHARSGVTRRRVVVTVLLPVRVVLDTSPLLRTSDVVAGAAGAAITTSVELAVPSPARFDATATHRYVPASVAVSDAPVPTTVVPLRVHWIPVLDGDRYSDIPGSPMLHEGAAHVSVDPNAAPLAVTVGAPLAVGGDKMLGYCG